MTMTSPSCLDDLAEFELLSVLLGGLRVRVFFGAAAAASSSERSTTSSALVGPEPEGRFLFLPLGSERFVVSSSESESSSITSAIDVLVVALAPDRADLDTELELPEAPEDPASARFFPLVVLGGGGWTTAGGGGLGQAKLFVHWRAVASCSFRFRRYCIAIEGTKDAYMRRNSSIDG